MIYKKYKKYLVLVEFQKATTEQKTIYLAGIEVPDSWKDSNMVRWRNW